MCEGETEIREQITGKEKVDGKREKRMEGDREKRKREKKKNERKMMRARMKTIKGKVSVSE